MDSRGSLAWFGRQTHNLECVLQKGPRPEVASSNPAPGTNETSKNEKLKTNESEQLSNCMQAKQLPGVCLSQETADFSRAHPNKEPVRKGFKQTTCF